LLHRGTKDAQRAIRTGATATIARLRRTPERVSTLLGSEEMEVEGTEIRPARREGRSASTQRQGTKSKALERRIELVSAVTIAVIISAAALHWMQPVMVPLILAVAVSQVLLPVVDFQMQLIPMPRPLAVGLSLLFTFAVLGFVGLLLFSSIKELVRDIKMYEQNVKKLLDRTTEILRQRGVGFDSLNTQFEELHLADMALKVTNYVFSQAFVIVELTFLVLLFSVYLLLGQGAGGIPVPRKGMVGRIESRIKRYLSIKFVISVGVGISTSLVFVSLQVHLAVLWGFLNFLLNFIPNVGPIIATMIPIPLILVSAETSGLTLILAIALPTSLHIFWGYILEPKVMGDSLDLHPISVMLCLIFWGMLWGIPGMFMAAPITAALKIVFEAADLTRPFARLLGGHLDSGDEVYEGDDEDTEEEEDANPAYFSKETDKLV